MALFDENNPGKNLMNATIWLDSSKSSDDSEYSEPSKGSSNSDRDVAMLVMMGGAILAVPLLILWLVGHFL